MNAFINYLAKELDIEIIESHNFIPFKSTYAIDNQGNITNLFLEASMSGDPIIKDFDLLLPIAEHLKKLSITGGYISNINSIDQFKKLEYLDLAGNPISDFDAISELTNLTYLRLFGTNISSNTQFEFLHPLEKLEHLNLSSTEITSIIRT
ncbi:leucine-rich repeat domain-containing protein [Flavobacterium oreochromis]|uniref:leucine-rich repeat domain-containing protein n=1 Tax=Flavobacterium oreochromis TaxID=2906078 RepID=UPI001CE666D1|nr:leucine-rich repeat domain-containing protein [Flavobacterium oreochromis]QYS85533.1 leucine-rich repeat domain-containing protein [Flavobacterium oreochromis]